MTTGSDGFRNSATTALGKFRSKGPDSEWRTPSSEHRVALRPGHIQQFQFERNFTTVLIGDTEVIDVVAQTEKSLAIQGKMAGVTNLAVLNTEGEEMYNVSVEVVEGPVSRPEITRADVPRVPRGGKVTVHAKPNTHDYYAYRCTETECQRVPERYDYDPQPSPIIVVPPLQSTNQTPRPPGSRR